MEGWLCYRKHKEQITLGPISKYNTGINLDRADSAGSFQTLSWQTFSLIFATVMDKFVFSAKSGIIYVIENFYLVNSAVDLDQNPLRKNKKDFFCKYHYHTWIKQWNTYESINIFNTDNFNNT